MPLPTEGTAAAGPSPPPDRPAPLPWAIRLLMVAAILLPMLGAAMLAAKEWRSIEEGAALELERAGALAQEHAQKVFETANLVLERVLDRLQGRSWSAIAAEGEGLVRWLRSI
ncbi:MAG: hypothetical protein N2588_04275, partial [Rhodovarius sp.]|nr:hypothetical protein [Rhodovarius sp.]